MNNQESSILAYFSANCDPFDTDFDIAYVHRQPFLCRGSCAYEWKITIHKSSRHKGWNFSSFLRPLSDVWATVIATAPASIAELRNQISHSALNIFPR